MRIRTIKPEFWRSDDISSLPRELRLLFVGLWSYVDDNGVGVDDYRQIAADLFALEEDIVEARGFVREGLATLSRVLLIDRYEVAGKPYLFVRTWDRHQRVDRPNKARHPRPDAVTSGNGDPRESSRDLREDLAPGTGEQRNRGTEEQEETSSSEIADAITDETGPTDVETVPREDVEALCRHLADRIEGNGSKRPRVTKAWREQARLLLDRDGRDVDKAHRLIDWCQDHHHWRSRVQAFPKFRDHYDAMRLQAISEHERRNGTGPRPVSTTDQRVAGALALLRPDDDDPPRAIDRGES